MCGRRGVIRLANGNLVMQYLGAERVTQNVGSSKMYGGILLRRPVLCIYGGVAPRMQAGAGARVGSRGAGWEGGQRWCLEESVVGGEPRGCT